jgi:hypothetical protein
MSNAELHAAVRALIEAARRLFDGNCPPGSTCPRDTGRVPTANAPTSSACFWRQRRRKGARHAE